MKMTFINVLQGNPYESKIKYVCSCGSESFHVFMRYKSKNIERFRCNECNKTYEHNGNEYSEIDIKMMWDKVVNSAR